MKKVGLALRTELDGTWYLEAHPKICDFFKEAGCLTYCEKLQSFHQQGKQRLLYNLFEEMQSVLSQAVVVGISCHLDADQLLEKRVRSHFSHTKLLFSPPSVEDLQRLLEHTLLLPTDSNFPHGAYAAKFNARLMDITENKDFKEILNNVMNVDLSVRRILDFIFRSICDCIVKTKVGCKFGSNNNRSHGR
jgi:hypothetical protein